MVRLCYPLGLFFGRCKAIAQGRDTAHSTARTSSTVDKRQSLTAGKAGQAAGFKGQLGQRGRAARQGNG